ncbi:MAG: TasA family protein [bacterium]|nr:TasA family protein [bacterium]
MNKIIVGIGSILFVTALVVGTTGAYFTDSKTTGENRFSAGTLSIGVEQTMQGSLPVIVNNWAPGESALVQYSVKNTGSLPVHIRSSYTGAWNFSGDKNLFKVLSVEKFNENNSTWSVLMQNSSGISQNSPVFLSQSGTDSGLTVLSPGQTLNMRLNVLFDPSAGNEYQGKQFSALVAVDAKQTTEGATWPSTLGGGGTTPNNSSSVIINQVSPTNAMSGQTVTIIGSGFVVGSNFVLFNTLDGTGGTNFSAVSNDGAILTFSVPNLAEGFAEGIYLITVMNDNGRSNTMPFAIQASDSTGGTQTDSLSIQSVTPSKSQAFNSVSIKGNGFVVNGDNHVMLSNNSGGSMSLLGTSHNGKSLNFQVPDISYGSYNVQVINSNGQSNLLSFTILEPTLTLTDIAISKTSGVAGDSVVITGSGFLKSEDNYILFGNSQGSFTFVQKASDSNVLTFTIPNTVPGAYTVEVLNSNGRSNPMSFTLVASQNPQITVTEPFKTGVNVIKGSSFSVRWQNQGLKSDSAVDIYLKNSSTNEEFLIKKGVDAGQSVVVWDVPTTFKSGIYSVLIKESCNAGDKCAAPAQSTGTFKVID